MELTQSIQIPKHIEPQEYEIDLFCNEVPYDFANSNEEQVFLGLGHWDMKFQGSLVIKKFIKLDNIHKDKENFFTVDIEEIEKYGDLSVALLHTHNNFTTLPSNEDIENHPKELLGGIYSPITNHITWWNGFQFNL